MENQKEVLDKGKVVLVDSLGTDQRIVNAARVSYGAGTKKVRSNDGLIKYLIRNGHNSPLEQVVFTFFVRAPLFVTRQFFRHRMARVNEVSARYSVVEDEFYIPETERIKAQDSKNRQASGEPLTPERQNFAVETISKASTEAYTKYQKLLDEGVAREIARMVLPQNMYTSFYWQMDLNNLFKFLGERLSPGAQWEIQQYAAAIQSLAQGVAPVAFETFEQIKNEENTEK